MFVKISLDPMKTRKGILSRRCLFVFPAVFSRFVLLYLTSGYPPTIHHNFTSKLKPCLFLIKIIEATLKLIGKDNKFLFSNLTCCSAIFIYLSIYLILYILYIFIAILLAIKLAICLSISVHFVLFHYLSKSLDI